MKNFVALVTPCHKSGKIDWFNFIFLIKFHIFNKITKILLFGTTGESFNFSNKDYLNCIIFLKMFKNYFIFGVSEKKNKTFFNLLFLLKKNNFNLILLSIPSFILPNNFSIFKYLKLIKKIGLKLIFYYIPKRNKYIFKINFLKKIIKKKLFFCFKNSLNDLKRNVIFKKNKIILFSGDDLNLFNCKFLNYKGTISVLNNIQPKIFNNIKNKKKVFENFFFNINPIFIKKILFKNSMINNIFNTLLFDLNYFYFTQSQT